MYCSLAPQIFFQNKILNLSFFYSSSFLPKSNGWYAIPSPEIFSRHSGTCLVLGDRHNVSAPCELKLGDCFRLGSVGLVVTEYKTATGEEQRLDSSIVQFLKDEALAFDSQEDMAALAADEADELDLDQANRASMPAAVDGDDDLDEPPASPEGGGEDGGGGGSWKSSSPKKHGKKSSPTSNRGNQGGVGNGERFICYMCYETHDTAEDPLVAPCDCKGDTRYLHVQCMQRWYQASVTSHRAQVIRTTG